ncbi:MAG: homoserine dehydrogenase [Saprospiraceae bacterium]
MEAIKIGLIGLGTVGTGTVAVLDRNASEITRRAGRDIKVVQAAVKDMSKPRNCDLSSVEVVNDPFLVVNNPEIDVVVELIGGETLAKDLILTAISNGKHVVTANKALIALHGNEIFAAAQEKSVIVAFEAAVAGGISIIKAIREGMAGNRIEWLAGIINGTSNYILTELEQPGVNFSGVLKDAQDLGYAEADPTFDIEGIDAAHKLTILASIAYGIPLQFEAIYTEGITQVTHEDVLNAKELGYRIKHLGIARRNENGIELRVHPTLVPSSRLLANVNGVMNAVVVKGDAVGSTLHYGPGAGSEPTASAVVADVVDVVRVITADPHNRVPHLAFQPDALAEVPIVEMQKVETAYYLRLQLQDKAGVLAEITELLAEAKINISSLLQKGNANERSDSQADNVTAVILTEPTVEGQFRSALKKIEALDSVVTNAVSFRVESLS